MEAKAFVFGKFLPFHAGHRAMIDFALANSAQLVVLVCCEKNEPVPCSKRLSWIKRTYTSNPKIEVRAVYYCDSELPATSQTSEAVSELWAQEFLKLVPDCSLLVTSEPYGELTAAAMQIQHLPFNPERSQVPVSATAICENVFEHWHFVPPAVRPDLAFKVALYGTESTGKSTLAVQLAQHFNGALVAEAGRELIPDSRHFTLADLQTVAAEQTARIKQAATGDSPVVICDTTAFITASYARFAFGEELQLTPDMRDHNQAALNLYLPATATYVQDGTRLPEDQRNQLDRIHRETLANAGLDVVELRGPQHEWLAHACVLVAEAMRQFRPL